LTLSAVTNSIWLVPLRYASTINLEPRLSVPEFLPCFNWLVLELCPGVS
jgi:hypothetical protein